MRPAYNLSRTQVITQAVAALENGNVIAYPTEAVYGLGCDPFNPTAVEKLFSLKQRPSSKGLILIAAHRAQIQPLIAPDQAILWDDINNSWPGPVTWVFPASDKVPAWISGEHHSIALRVTNHAIAHALCEAFNQPIVSTSANPTAQAPAKTAQQIQDYFPYGIEYVVDSECGTETKPSVIRDALTGNILRK